MADIDKTLPNIRRPEDEVAEEINVEEIQESNGPVEITDDAGQYYDEFVEELLDMNFKNSTK